MQPVVIKPLADPANCDSLFGQSYQFSATSPSCVLCHQLQLCNVHHSTLDHLSTGVARRQDMQINYGFSFQVRSCTPAFSEYVYTALDDPSFSSLRLVVDLVVFLSFWLGYLI
eukprot:scpid94432/ scgid11905/ 